MSRRIDALKIRSYDYGRYADTKTRDMLFSRGLYEYRTLQAVNVKRARIDYYILERYPIEIDPQELLVGRFACRHFYTQEELEAFERAGKYRDEAGSLNGGEGGGTGHRVIDYEKLLSVGVTGYLEEIKHRRGEVAFDDPEAVRRLNFYEACTIELEGLLHFAARYEQKLLELAHREEDPGRIAEYKRLAGVFARVPRYPAGSFYEAVQCVWFVEYTACLLMDTVLTGRPDQYLYPYYIKDREAGILTDQEAMELIENLYLKHNEIYDSWPASIMAGGLNRKGEPVWNPLTRMLIDAVESTGLVNPSVAVCYNDDMPEELLLRCADIISKGYTRPSLFNDRVVIDGLLDAGVSPEDARYYIHSTCVEITPIGSSNIMVAMPYINLCKALEYLFGGGKAIFGEPCRLYGPVDFSLEELGDFDAFFDRLKDVIAQIIKEYLAGVCEFACYKENHTSTPFVSVFTRDCLERGMDSVSGGARYNFVYPCFPGFLNLADSVSAIRKAVYREKKITLEELGRMLKTDFRDEEAFRQYLLNRCPKFGNDEPEDDIAEQLYEYIRSELKKYRISVGGTFHPSYFAWIMHGKLGESAAATPDGRRQGTALSECLGAVQGMDRQGPLAVMRSVSKLEQKYGIGGIATNFRFSRSMLADAAGKQALADFIRTFMHSGCFEIQFNVVDQQTLLEAQAHPEKYRNLLVRVAGYSDYFVDLDPIIQNEIISRSEHGEF